jgi:thymidine kinase
MAKLYFYYSAMNAGKSTLLLQSAYNYNERGMDTLIFSPALDERFGKGKISSRLGLSADAVTVDNNFNLYDYTKKQNNKNLSCVLIYEAQFLTKDQVWQLSDIVDKLNLPVLAFGIRSDFQGEPFPGSQALLVLADKNIGIIMTIFPTNKST